MVEAFHVSYTLESCNFGLFTIPQRVSDIKFEEMNPVGDAVEVINSVRSRNIWVNFLWHGCVDIAV